MSTVLVTGGSGFVGSHCVLHLLNAGHEVRTTVRNARREPEVRALVEGAGAGQRLTFAVADLENDAGWEDAVRGCEYVLHVASPFPSTVPADPNALIAPARDGALRVLRAARDAGVRRVVLTSSFAAIGYGHPPQSRPFDEETWTNADSPDAQAYVKSKTLAERAAWEFVAREGRSLELAVVNPVGVFGPLLGPDLSTSILLIQRMLNGQMPGCPKMAFGVVDVRDVADLHVRAMTDPAAAGQRFLAVAGDFMSIRQMALTLRERLGPAARRVRTFELPSWLVRLAALRDPAVKQIVPELGNPRNATSAKARTMLGWAPRTREDALEATARSLMALGLVKA